MVIKNIIVFGKTGNKDNEDVKPREHVGMSRGMLWNILLQRGNDHPIVEINVKKWKPL